MENWTPREWTNNSGQKINAEALNYVNEGIVEALDGVDEAHTKLNEITPTAESVSFSGGGSGILVRNGIVRQLIIKALNKTFTSSWQSFDIYSLKEKERPLSNIYSSAIQNDNGATGHVVLTVNGDKTSADWGKISLGNKGGTYPTGSVNFYGSVTWVVGY